MRQNWVDGENERTVDTHHNRVCGYRLTATGDRAHLFYFYTVCRCVFLDLKHGVIRHRTGKMFSFIWFCISLYMYLISESSHREWK